MLVRVPALDRRHLRATHIKPWCECDDGEKLDGLNGLLMSPHLAHLFERGYVSFSDAGELLVSQELNPAVLLSWKLELPLNVGAFVPRQCRYLEYHRREVFERHGGGRRQQSVAAPVGAPVALQAEPATVNPP
jgi:putative restriction endonuclease